MGLCWVIYGYIGLDRIMLGYFGFRGKKRNPATCRTSTQDAVTRVTAAITNYQFAFLQRLH